MTEKTGNYELEIKSAFHDREAGHVTRFEALVEVSYSCKVIFSGYLGTNGKLYITHLGNALGGSAYSSVSMLQFATWLTVYEGWLQHKVEGAANITDKQSK